MQLYLKEDTHTRSLLSATPDIGRRERRWRRHWSPHNVWCFHTTCTPWPGWCSSHKRCAESKASYTGGGSGSGSLQRRKYVWGYWNVNVYVSYWLISKLSLRIKEKPRLTDWFLTDESVCVGSAGICPEARDLSSLQVSTEAWVIGLTWQPLQRGVSERRHVLPAPVWHVDLPQANPWGQFLHDKRNESHQQNQERLYKKYIIQDIIHTYLRTYTHTHTHTYTYILVHAHKHLFWMQFIAINRFDRTN